MDSEIVYLEINDWYSSQEEENFLNHLSNFDLETEKVCISCEVWDQSMNYWVTCGKTWLEENFPELITETIEKEPEHLDWKPENYGYHFIT